MGDFEASKINHDNHLLLVRVPTLRTCDRLNWTTIIKMDMKVWLTVDHRTNHSSGSLTNYSGRTSVLPTS